MNIKKIGVLTDASGDFSTTAHITGEILAVALDIGDLSTPDLTIADDIVGTAVFAKTGIAADGYWAPRVLLQSAAGVNLAAAAGPPALNDQYGPVTVVGRVSVVVAGGGNTKSGVVYIAYRG